MDAFLGRARIYRADKRRQLTKALGLAHKNVGVVSEEAGSELPKLPDRSVWT